MKKMATMVMMALVLIGTGLSQELIRKSPGKWTERSSGIQIGRSENPTKNLTKTAKEDAEVFTTPFVDDFNSEEEFAERWDVSDPQKVQWDGISGYAGVGGRVSFWSADEDKWLMTKVIQIEAGKAYIGFYAYVMGSARKTDTLVVKYGHTSDISKMQLLGDTITGIIGESGDKHHLLEFTSDGEPYYFAFQTNDKGTVYLDVIEINTGEFTPWSSLMASNLVFPMPGCGNDEIEVTADITNQGTGTAYGFKAECAVNGAEAIEFAFPDTIPSGETKTVRFSGIRLQSGENKISVNTADNPSYVTTGNAYNHLPIMPPHRFDFSKCEMIDVSLYDDNYNKVWQILDTNNVQIFDYSQADTNTILHAPFETEAPFLSTCIQLDANILYRIKFDYRGGLYHGTDFQHGILLLGKAGTDWVNWDCIWNDSMIFSEKNWWNKEITVSVKESGSYSIGFISSPDRVEAVGMYGSTRMGLQLRNIAIEIEKGAPTLQLDNIKNIIPLSGCDLDEEEITFKVNNYGKEPVSGFWAWYSLNDTLRVEEYFDTTIAARGSVELSFSQKIHTDPGTKNKFSISISGESANWNYFYHHFPLETPHTIDMAKQEVIGNGGWVIEYPGWGDPMDPTQAVGHNEMNPLYTTCFNFKANTTYRMAFNYAAGSIFQGGERVISDDCRLYLFRTGTDWKEGERIWHEPEVLSDGQWEQTEVSFQVEEDGQYAFAFALGNSSYGGFMLKNISVAEHLAYDVRLDQNAAFNFAKLMPSDQVNTTGIDAFRFENRGTRTLGSLKVSAVFNGIEVGKTSIADADAKKDGSIEVSIDNATVGDTGIYCLTALIEGHEDEDINPDHSITNQFVVTDTVMSWYRPDTVGWNYVGDNSGSGRRAFGLPFVFRSLDTLTSVTVGWCTTPLNMEMDATLVIYRLDETRRRVDGDPVYSATVHRGKEIGWATYPVPDLMLKGAYFVGLVQTTPYTYGLSVEHHMNYISDKGLLYDYTIGSDTIYVQDEYGTPAIRLHLGHHGKPLEIIDVAPMEIREPYHTVGAFSANQPIRVNVRNLGGNIISNIKVFGLINKTLLDPVSIPLLEPYASTDVTLMADMSLPETTYELCLFTVLLEDGNRANDTIRMTVSTVPAIDPYVMDFEYCEAFSITNFEPAWTTVDRDKSGTYGWQDIDFPNVFSEFAFMAFNPYRTDPVLMDLGTESDQDMIAPYQGSHFGASFVTVMDDADDWLISPKLKMPNKGSFMDFYVKSFVNTYGYDKYKVLVSNTDNKPESFEIIEDVREAPSWGWSRVGVDLSEYDGQEIYVAIQHFQEKNEGFLFMIDNIQISKTGAGVESSDPAAGLSLYPNPAKDEVVLFSAVSQINRVEIFNVGGQRIFVTREGFEQNDCRLNVSCWQPGIYFARVYTALGEAVLKFTVLK